MSEKEQELSVYREHNSEDGRILARQVPDTQLGPFVSLPTLEKKLQERFPGLTLEDFLDPRTLELRSLYAEAVELVFHPTRCPVPGSGGRRKRFVSELRLVE